MMMKTHSILFKLLLIAGLVLTGSSVKAADGFAYEKKKVITKTYPLSRNSKVSINNSFGQVTINHWKNNEVKIIVTIIASANSESVAQQVLDGISIIENEGETISFKTKINSEYSGHRKTNNRKQSMQINYEVFLPEQTTLAVTNSFGPTFVPKRSGKTSLTQSFGDLKTGYLKNLDKLSVEFGKLISDGFENADANFKFSKIEIEKLSGDINSNFEFCTKPSIKLSPSVKAVNINTSYSDLIIAVPTLFKANVEIKTKFGDLKNNSDIKLNNESSKKEKFDKRYIISVPSSSINVNISNEFGKITLQ